MLNFGFSVFYRIIKKSLVLFFVFDERASCSVNIPPVFLWQKLSALENAKFGAQKNYC